MNVVPIYSAHCQRKLRCLSKLLTSLLNQGPLGQAVSLFFMMQSSNIFTLSVMISHKIAIYEISLLRNPKWQSSKETEYIKFDVSWIFMLFWTIIVGFSHMLHKLEWISLDHAIHVNSNCSLTPKFVMFVTKPFKYQLKFYKIPAHFLASVFFLSKILFLITYRWVFVIYHLINNSNNVFWLHMQLWLLFKFSSSVEGELHILWLYLFVIDFQMPVLFGSHPYAITEIFLL